MSKFTQLNRIREIDDTAKKAVESYGSFVKYANELTARIKSSYRRGWTPDRISYAECVKAVPFFHQAISDKFGSDAMFEAINAHPFS
jgi:hypothetical protein